MTTRKEGVSGSSIGPRSGVRMPLSAMPATPLSRTPRYRGFTGAVLRRYGTAEAPASIVANVGCFLLSVWLLDSVQPGYRAHAEAWRMVAIVILMSVQAMWLVWLHRQRIGTYAASLVLWSLAILIGGFEALAVQPGIFVVVFGLSAGTSRWTRGLLVGGGMVLIACADLAAYALYAPSGAPPWHAAPVIVSAAVAALATVAVPAFGGGWYAQLRDHAERVVELARHATTSEASRTSAAVAAERRSLATEIHDTSSAHLTAILALSAAARSRSRSAESDLASLIQQIHDEGQSLFQGYERMLESLQQDDRTITETFRPGYRPGQHSTSELPALVADFRRASEGAVSFEHEPDLETIDKTLGPIRSHTAYRVVQEALNNVRKHASGADVNIRLDDDGDSLLIRIENSRSPIHRTAGDSRRGPSLHLGINGIRDRLIAAGGSLRTGPRRSGGWVVQALLPHPQYSGDAGSAGREHGVAKDLDDASTATQPARGQGVLR